MSIFRSMDFGGKLAQIRTKSPTAVDQGKGECCRSGVCCWRRPCDLVAEDVPRIAAHLGLSETDLFNKYLSVNTPPAGGGYNLHPRRGEHGGGKMLSADETYDLNTPCVFLDVKNGNACKIHEVKPKGGRDFKCWEPATGTLEEQYAAYSWTRDALVALGWDGRDPDDVDWGDDDEDTSP